MRKTLTTAMSDASLFHPLLQRKINRAERAPKPSSRPPSSLLLSSSAASPTRLSARAPLSPAAAGAGKLPPKEMTPPERTFDSLTIHFVLTGGRRERPPTHSSIFGGAAASRRQPLSSSSPTA